MISTVVGNAIDIPENVIHSIKKGRCVLKKTTDWRSTPPSDAAAVDSPGGSQRKVVCKVGNLLKLEAESSLGMAAALRGLSCCFPS